MKALFHTIFFTLLCGAVMSQSSVLQSGRWYKIAIEEPGIYRISHDDFRKMGFDPGKIDPRTIQIFGQHGGMIPQMNSIQRPGDLVELAIEVTGESDGVFDRQDFVLFYGTGSDKVLANVGRRVLHYENNLYDDTNYYFVTAGSSVGKRVTQKSAGSGGDVVDTFQDVFFHEKDEHNELKSGREWFGERFDIISEHSIEFPMPGIVSNEPVAIVSDVMAQSVSPSAFRIFFNNFQVGDQLVPQIPNTTYGAKGRHKRDTLTFLAAAAGADKQDRQTIRFSYTRGSSGRSVGYLNFFSAHVTRALKLYGEQTVFRNVLVTSPVEYRVSGVSQTDRIWNITNAYEPQRQLFNLNGASAVFSDSPQNETVSEFIVFTTRHKVPRLVGRVENQNLRGLAAPNYIVVTHPAFLEEAQRLAAHRQRTNGWSTAVVTTDQVFNEFASGRQDVSAMRDFVRHLYSKNPDAVKVLLLFGKCSYDYKNRIPGNTNFVPTYESRNSLAPLETYSSDDFFGFLEEGEGDWGENSFLQTHTLDIGVGRIPVTTPEEARTVVDKLVDYDNNSSRFGSWRKDIVFVADDGSNSDGFTSIHQSQANVLAENIEFNYPVYNTRKIFLGTYPKIVSPNGETVPKANHDLKQEFGQSVIINYTGHGSEKLWADERILNEDIVNNLTNTNYPFLVTATCEFGRHDNPAEISGAERSMLLKKAGSIGLVTTARPVNSSTNFSLNAAFYDALFILNPNQSLSVGEVFRHTKNNSASGVANRNFSLLGDPGMKIALPQSRIVTEEVRTIHGSDTLKALSTVRVRGYIDDGNGNVDVGFSGTVQALLFDKRTKFETIGRNDPKFTFSQWYNPLFRGDASVNNGAFEITFVIPRNIAYEFDYGKLSLYAVNDQRTKDVGGAGTSFKIGGTEDSVAPDNKAPRVAVFIGDTTFVPGNMVSPDTWLVVRTSDESGINISNYGIGNTMMAALDGDAQVFLLNQHYVADKDDHTKGWIRYPLADLSPGRHSITVKIWDTHNNPAEATVSFMVSQNGAMVIESFGNYPNPFRDETTFVFTHNRSGEELQVRLTLLNAAGQEISSLEKIIEGSTLQTEMPFDITQIGKKLPSGVYLGRLQIRSLSDGGRSERVTRVIVAN